MTPNPDFHQVMVKPTEKGLVLAIANQACSAVAFFDVAPQSEGIWSLFHELWQGIVDNDKLDVEVLLEDL